MQEIKANSQLRASILNGPICPEVLLKAKLSPAQKIVWLTIRNHEGKNRNAWPAAATIARNSGLSVRAVKMSVDRLEELGWLKVDRSNSGNTYECWIPDLVVQEVHEGSAKSAQPGSAKFAHKPIQREPIHKPIASAPPPRSDLQKVVDHFFDLQGYSPEQRKAAYPRHVREGAALLKAAGDAEKAKAILDQLQRWCSSKRLSYTIGTALKRWKQFSDAAPSEDYAAKMARIQAEIDKYENP